MARNGKRALVTGGAGLIGSHVTDLLVRDGWKVRVLDNLEPNTHKRGTPAWINERAEFVEGDVRDRETITAALDKIKPFTAKALESAGSTHWFFQACGQ
jgi:dTDP-L-rhamnose 4-epimerase